MFAVQRANIIKKYLMNKKQVEVNSLSKLLDVSEVTIRRDLEKLEKEGFLIRTHGGAILNEQKNSNDIKTTLNDEILEDYNGIADIAAHMIDDSDTIMLFNGPINLQIAKKISQKNNVTILTNDILIANELTKNPSIKTVLLGGTIDCASKATFGTLATSNIDNFFVNKVFIEIDGITPQMQLTASSLEKASLIKLAIEISDEKIAVCTADAFDKPSFFYIDKLDIVDKIITSPRLSDEKKNYIFNKNVQLFTSIKICEGSE
ncbi:MAG: DeoR/GlpR family DNA-binding transcription regulator [Xylanivirga thermophila]|jgi:DeoR family transcriptional regulator, fructose operon transcriptional repressor|uniref:DeoR/GlpR family DNA-binding transcription regulator n=1 Tax=Xylanivirga thermophila TaxID=2496273 RepID=UPI00101BDE9F|nr:DeoR/GlpR family DNA-binding transcription regulator [Xylanivirga thermophila]